MSKVRLYGDTSGFVDLKAPDVASNVTITLPNTTGPFATETYVNAAVALAGRLVAAKHVLKTNTFSASVAAGGATAVTGLSISHAAADAANTIYLIAQLNGTHSDANKVAGRIAADGVGLAIGDGDGGNRTRAGSSNSGVDEYDSQSIILMATHSPGSTASVTYDVRVTPVRGGTTTCYVNRARTDINVNYVARTASALFLFEVAE